MNFRSVEVGIPMSNWQLMMATDVINRVGEIIAETAYVLLSHNPDRRPCTTASKNLREQGRI